MNTNCRPFSPHNRRRAGFTLVELLTVIAIIAILTAVLLPVFAAVRENARRTACMSNMREMYAGIKQYELDNRRYPDYLFAPAIASDGSGGCAVVPAGSGKGTDGYPILAGSGAACTPAQAAATGKLGGNYANADNSPSAFSGGLYPEYVKAVESFHCPNNLDDDTASDTNTAAVARTDISTTPAGSSNTNVGLYKYDSYDSNPSITSAGTLNTAVYQDRYSRLWQQVVDGSSASPFPVDTPTDRAFQNYKNALFWKAPSSDTYLTMCTYHVPKGKVIVLWLGGAAKVLDVNKLRNLANGSAMPNLSGTNGRDYDLYKLAPTD